MSFGIGAEIEVITMIYLGRWVYPFQRGIIERRHVSPAGQEIYEVRLTDNEVYMFAPGEIEEINKGRDWIS